MRASGAGNRVCKFTNSSGSTTNPAGVLAPLPGFEDQPARFQMANQRYSQWAPTGTIYHNSVNDTTGYRFNNDGTDVEPYAYGYRGGTGASTINGDSPSPSQPDGSPVTTQYTQMRAESDRKTLFGNFEYNLTERTTAYLQTNYAKTDGLSRNQPSSGSYCVRFDGGGTAGTNVLAGGRIYFTTSTTNLGTVDGESYPDGTVIPIRSTQLNPIGATLAVFLGTDQLNSSNKGTTATAGTAPLPGSGTNPGPAVGPLNGGIGTSYLTGNGVGPNNTPFYSTRIATVGTTVISDSRGVFLALLDTCSDFPQSAEFRLWRQWRGQVGAVHVQRCRLQYDHWSKRVDLLQPVLSQ